MSKAIDSNPVEVSPKKNISTRWTRAWLVRKSKSIPVYVAAVLITIVMMIPIFWMVSTALKTPTEIFSNPLRWWPAVPQFQNFVTAWQSAPFGSYLFNSLSIAISVVAVSLLTSVLAAFGFSHLDFPGRNFLFGLMMVALMLPMEIALIPNFLTIRRMGLSGSFSAFVLPFTTSAFNIFLLRQHFLTIPRDYYDAAVIDGCSPLRYLRSILLPLSGPVLATLTIFGFMSNYNSYLWPLVITSGEKMRTVTIGLQTFLSAEGSSQWELMMAATLIVSLPTIILFLFAQKYFVKGNTLSGLKG
jgi:multiple sugar transport system permease protein